MNDFKSIERNYILLHDKEPNNYTLHEPNKIVSEWN